MPVGSGAVLGIALVALAMVLTPGPNMLYLASRSISQGTSAGFVSLGGTAVGFVVYLTMANLGLAAVFVVVPWLYTALKVAGALYLLYLAIRAVSPGGIGLFEVRDLARDTNARLFSMGLATNLLNPKAAIMYVALIPQFIVPAHGQVVAQGFILGGVQIAVSMAVNSLIILAAGAIAAFLRRRPRWLTWQRRATATLLAGVGIGLLVEAPAPATTAG
ncbi:Threonine/homoserine/homoserine lactone efflux protein [Agromyces sp. CF514]|uniref:LysE family translocator n=1 Tax=Agromyces sp. CF514 TaxID=1881031 RepID=UPI0008E9321D|nr:LysE family translocator [Agromyces sp. CF514]SFR66701.1 Threonine/homoserine/homoserine lactone efflux protein [Agromyces sp. CF514]